RKLQSVYAFDKDKLAAERFKEEFIGDVEVVPVSLHQLGDALKGSDICVTCTPAKTPFISLKDIRPGTFIAAVGADSENKRELHAGLMASAKVVVDSLDQCATIGELH